MTAVVEQQLVIPFGSTKELFHRRHDVPLGPLGQQAHIGEVEQAQFGIGERVAQQRRVVHRPLQGEQILRVLAVASHADGLAAGGGDRGGPGQDWADPAWGGQLRSSGPDEEGAGPGVVGDLAVEEVDAAGHRAQAGRGRDGLGVPGGSLAQPSQAVTSWRVGKPQPPVERSRSGDHQGVELALGVGGGLDWGASRAWSAACGRSLWAG